MIAHDKQIGEIRVSGRELLDPNSSFASFEFVAEIAVQFRDIEFFSGSKPDSTSASHTIVQHEWYEFCFPVRML